MDTTSRRNRTTNAASPVKAFTSQHALQARQKQYKMQADAEAAFNSAGATGFGWRKTVSLIDDR